MRSGPAPFPPGTTNPRDHGPLVLGSALAVVFFMVRALSPGILDSGDGTLHYLIARYAWRHAETGLDQWGKPLFSLVASPFVQCAPAGLTLFNGVCMALAGLIIAYTVFPRGKSWAWLPALLLFGCPQVAYTVLAGLTEPLFGLLALLVFVLIERDRFATAMALFSFLPYARPEYTAIAPFAIGYVCWRRRWKALPWLLLGSTLYAIASGVLLGRPWQFFTDHNYAGRDTYGTGELLHFWERREEVLGTPLAWMTLFSMVACAWFFWRSPERRGPLFRLVWLSLFPALAIFLLHSYAWWKGGLASLGLLRVMTCAVPLLVYFIVRMLDVTWTAVPRATTVPWVVSILIAGYGSWAYTYLRARLPMPIHADALQLTEQQAAQYIRSIRKADNKLFYISPHLGALCGVDPWDEHRMDRRFYGMHDVSEQVGMKTGDIVAWDAQFGHNEGNSPLDSFLLDPRFELLRSFRPRTPITSGGRPYGVHVFRRVDDTQRAGVR